MSDENFIPMRRRQLIELCSREVGDPSFRKLCRIVEATVHHDYRARIELFDELYAPVDPDADTASPVSSSGAADATAGFSSSGGVASSVTSDGEVTNLDKLESELVDLLEAADFVEIPHRQVARALEETALLDVRMEVDLDAYERVLFYGRGAEHRTETVKRWMGLREREVEFTNYARVLLYVRRPRSTGIGDDADADRGRVIIKLFRNVPEHDIEMLLPEPEVKMRLFDRLLLGVPAVVSGVLLITTKAGPQLLLLGALIAFWLGLRDRQVDFDQQTVLGVLMALMALGSFAWRQFSKYQSRRTEFLKQISERLYFKNLDNGAGVFHHLIDEAEDQECREAVLAMRVLHEAGEPLSPEQIDERAEDWLRRHLDREVDFEIGDALDKLERFGVLAREGERVTMLPLDDALRRMDEAWDAEFDFAAAR